MRFAGLTPEEGKMDQTDVADRANALRQDRAAESDEDWDTALRLRVDDVSRTEDEVILFVQDSGALQITNLIRLVMGWR